MTAVPQSQVSISRRALDVEDYIDLARRHVSWIVGPFYAGIVISTMIAFFLPNTYISRAMLRITPSSISENLVPATFSQVMGDRISTMWQEITSRTNLSELIQRPSLDLYKKERSRGTVEDMIEVMRNKDLQIQLVGTQSAGSGKPASAFQVSFTYPDRYKAQQVVAALVAKFTEANFNATKLMGNSTTELMKDEVTHTKQNLDKLDEQITAFKQANAGRLPEELNVNLNSMQAIQTQIAALSEGLNRNSQERMMREQNLTTLQQQYQQAEQAFATADPEPGGVAQSKNEELTQLNRDIHAAEAQLAVMKQSYTDVHPDMIEFKARLSGLKQRRDQLAKEDADEQAKEAAKTKPTPKRAFGIQARQSLSQMQANIDSTKTQMKILDLDRDRLQKQQEKFQAQLQVLQTRIAASPANEQKYAALVRERDMLATRYGELQHKLELALQGVEVNTRKVGENLEVLDPASLPESPTAPNRWQIVGLGAALGLVAGIALAGIKEMKDTSLKNLKDVRAYTNLPVLSSIPLLENALLVRRKRRLAYVGWAVAVMVGLLGTAISVGYHLSQK